MYISIDPQTAVACFVLSREPDPTNLPPTTTTKYTLNTQKITHTHTGGGVSQFAMVEFHERLLHSPSNTKDPKNTWRLALLLPSGMLILAALVVWALGTDTPR